MPDLSLDLQACYEYESFKKADGIEALVMGCPGAALGGFGDGPAGRHHGVVPSLRYQ